MIIQSLRFLLVFCPANLVFLVAAAACPVCQSEGGAEVRAGITNSFWSYLSALSAPFLLLGLGVGLYSRLPFRSIGSKEHHTAIMNTTPANKKPLVIAGVIMGVGLGGFFDGILFHQLLQTHSMLSAKFPPNTVRNLEINMFWDGLFHTLTYAMTLLGLRLLWRAGKRDDVPWSGRIYTGALFTGWGLFNLCEGLISHHIFHLHHVVEQHGVSWFDYGFLASGVLFIILGQSLIRSGETISRVSIP